MSFGLQDVMMIEGELDGEDQQDSELEYYTSIQRAINSGMWGLQGSYGRTMMDAISNGVCLLGTSSARDYYGNTIPSRDQVMAGTKGSFLYVANHMGTEWAKMMMEVE